MIDISKPGVRDDWQAYLVAADQLEEAGREHEATRLRRRGEVMRAIVEALTQLVWRYVEPRSGGRDRAFEKGELPGDAIFLAYRGPKIITLHVKWCRREADSKYHHWTTLHIRRDLLGRPDYLPGRIRELFEEHMMGRYL